MEVYHVETKEAYDDLMIELEEKGYKWLSWKKPTAVNLWFKYKETTCISISGKYISYGAIELYKKEYPETPIIEYKTKGGTDDFIKELTVKIYYNEITKKHYNSYEEAVADCRKEMKKLYDKN